MVNDTEKYITLIGEDNTEVLAEILFTFEYEEENYVLLTLVDEINAEQEEYEILAYKYEEKENKEIGNLIEIPDGSSDWDIVEEMFNTFEAGEFNG
ncbi:MAG: DUF1292 domain-containing protein [Mycoplasmatales bacterium]